MFERNRPINDRELENFLEGLPIATHAAIRKMHERGKIGRLRRATGFTTVDQSSPAPRQVYGRMEDVERSIDLVREAQGL